LLEVDPIGLVKGRSADSFALGQYVNDRPYAASSMLAMAMSRVFRTAMTGRCDARPDLAAADIPLEIRIPALPCTGGVELAHRMFEPLGWRLDARAITLDEQFPDWGDSRYLDVHLTGELRLADALSHLYVMLPVLDDAKHYWVSEDEVSKLIRAGTGWLASHPEKTLITQRYLAHQNWLSNDALTRLADVDEVIEPEDAPSPHVSLAELRRHAVLAALKGARRVGDFGCGEGALVAALLADSAVDHIVATDVSARSLSLAAKRLRLDGTNSRIEMFQSSLTYRDDRLRGLDAAVLMEVIEHIDETRLGALEHTLFGHARPARVIVTTPNSEHNVRFETMPAGTMRHRDHRFEWTRAQFRGWADRVAREHGYDVHFVPVGIDDPAVGPPSQLAMFRLSA
jgi:3' terminal RNA ribose 2'-O-methyltransferase Hen1